MESTSENKFVELEVIQEETEQTKTEEKDKREEKVGKVTPLPKKQVLKNIFEIKYRRCLYFSVSCYRKRLRLVLFFPSSPTWFSILI